MSTKSQRTNLNKILKTNGFNSLAKLEDDELYDSLQNLKQDYKLSLVNDSNINPKFKNILSKFIGI